MLTQSYFPNTEGDRVVWLTNFDTKIQIHATALALNPAELATTLTDIDFYVWVLQTWYPSIQQSALESTAYKLLIGYGTESHVIAVPSHAAITSPAPTPLPGVLTRLFNLIARIKIGTGYTESIGLDLGIVGSVVSSTPQTPEYTVTTERGPEIEQVSISFIKYRHDGVSIYSRRNQGDWEFLAVAMVKPWLDNRALVDPLLPEVREYRLRYWDKGDANGEYSAVQRVNVGP
ncbi:MAG: hypothetical protein NTY69_05970 [Methylococcales bacterium]|nr:hypothetical protein [Methylococcales bacterium]